GLPDDGLDVRGCGRWPGADPTNLVDRRREHLGSEEGPFDLTPVDDPDVVRVRHLSRLAGSDDDLMAAVETRVRDEPDRVRRELTKDLLAIGDSRHADGRPSGEYLVEPGFDEVLGTKHHLRRAEELRDGPSGRTDGRKRRGSAPRSRRARRTCRPPRGRSRAPGAQGAKRHASTMSCRSLDLPAPTGKEAWRRHVYGLGAPLSLATTERALFWLLWTISGHPAAASHAGVDGPAALARDPHGLGPRRRKR